MPDIKATRDLQLVDQVLSNIARQYTNPSYAYDSICPKLRVQYESGRFPVFDTGFFGDDTDDDTDGDVTKVSDRAPTPEISFEFSTDTYFCEDYRLKESITAKERRQAAPGVRIDQSKLTHLLEHMAIRREVRLAKILTDSGTTGGELTGGTAAPSNAWTVDAATIEADIKTGALAVRDEIGRLTNTILFDLAVAYAVAVQADIREIIKYTVPGDRIIAGGVAVLPPQIHGHKVVVSEAIRNTAKKGATESKSAVWADDARLLFVPPSPGWGTPAVCYAFEVFGETVDRWKENDPPIEYVRAWEDLDEKVCAPNGGYTLTSLLS